MKAKLGDIVRVEFDPEVDSMEEYSGLVCICEVVEGYTFPCDRRVKVIHEASDPKFKIAHSFPVFEREIVEILEESEEQE